MIGGSVLIVKNTRLRLYPSYSDSDNNLKYKVYRSMTLENAYISIKYKKVSKQLHAISESLFLEFSSLITQIIKIN